MEQYGGSNRRTNGTMERLIPSIFMRTLCGGHFSGDERAFRIAMACDACLPASLPLSLANFVRAMNCYDSDLITSSMA
jgi:hypothetical protein